MFLTDKSIILYCWWWSKWQTISIPNLCLLHLYECVYIYSTCKSSVDSVVLCGLYRIAPMESHKSLLWSPPRSTQCLIEALQWTGWTLGPTLKKVGLETLHGGKRKVCSSIMLYLVNPPTDRPFETIQNLHFQKCPLVLYTHGDTIWTVLVASCTTIQIQSNGFRGSIDSPLIQTRFCISWPTIQNHLGNQHCAQLFHHSKPQ